MKTKFKILSFVALFFIASVISVSTASAGIDIYPMATEDVYDANGGVHYALVYDIEPDHFINGYQPKIYGVGSNTKGAMWFLNQKEHLNEQTWDFVPSKVYPGKMALMIPTTYCSLWGVFGMDIESIISQIPKKNLQKLMEAYSKPTAPIGIQYIYSSRKPIYISTNDWVKSDPLAVKPVITSITPTQTTAGDFDLTIKGKYFNKNNIVDKIYQADGITLVGQGTIKSRTTSQIIVTQHMTGAAGTYVVKVRNNNIDPNTESNGKKLQINAPVSSKPVITSITPSQTGANTFDLTITGSNFDSGAVDQIYWQADGHFVGQGTVKSKTSSKIVVTQYMTGATKGNYIVKVKNSNEKISNGKTLKIT